MKAVAQETDCYQTASMVNVLIRDVSAEVHAALTRKALGEGVSLQQYLARELQALAGRTTMAEWVAMVEARLPLSSRSAAPFDSAAFLRQEQESRARRVGELLEADGAEGEAK